MSGYADINAYTPANVLLPTLSGAQTANVVAQQTANQQNQLLMPYRVQAAQQSVGAAEMDTMGRAAAGLLQLPDENARAAAYPGIVANLQRLGFAKNAPSAYPGQSALQSFVSQALPVEDQYKLGIITPPGTTAAINAALAPGSTSTTSVTPTTGGPIEPDAQARAMAVRDGLIKRGLDPDTATAFAANALHESSANPNTGPGDAGNSQGLFMWNGPRLQGYVAKYGHSPQGAPLDEQLDYVMSELNGNESLAKDRINQAQGVAAKAAQVSEAYLRPKDTLPEMQRRSGTALQLSQLWQRPGTPGATATTTPYKVASNAPVPPPTTTATTPPADTTAPAATTPAQPATTDLVGPRPLPPTGPGSPVVTPESLANTPVMVPRNALAPAAATTPPAPTTATTGTTPPTTTPPATATPGSAAAARANLPHASEVATGQQSPQYQQAADLQRRAMILEAQPDPTGRLKALAQGLRSQAQLLLQTDSVVQAQEGQVHTLTGAIDKPVGNYQETSPGSGVWVGGPGTEPRFQPPGRLIVTPGGDVYQTTPGGPVLLKHTDPQAVAALSAAQAQGTGTGQDVAKQLPALIAQARNAAQQEGQIDYASNQLREAAKGGIPTGYFSEGLATAAAAAKSLGINTSSLGIDPSAVGNVQTAQKTLAVIGGAILQQAIGKDSQITNDKIEAFIHTQPGIQNDPQALQRIMAWARSQYTYEREMGQAAVAEAAQSPTGTLPLNWQAKYYSQHGFAPVYDPATQEMQQPDGRQPARETPPASPATSTTTAPALPANAVSSLKEGTVTTFKNGQQWTLRNGQPVQVK